MVKIMSIENCKQRLEELHSIATQQVSYDQYVQCDDVKCVDCPLNISRSNDVIEVQCLLITISEKYKETKNQ
jgi:hypothetical protein